MSENNIIVRRTTKEDVVHVVSMIQVYFVLIYHKYNLQIYKRYSRTQELADFEKMHDGPELTAEDFIRDGNLDGASGTSLFFSFVAELTGETNRPTTLIGYTISFLSYSTWQGKSYFLEDLYVKPEFRKSGIGKKLFKANVDFALENNCKRFDFHVLNWNPAKKFYESLGATNLSEKEGWEFFRLKRSDMERLASNMQ